MFAHVLRNKLPPRNTAQLILLPARFPRDELKESRHRKSDSQRAFPLTPMHHDNPNQGEDEILQVTKLINNTFSNSCCRDFDTYVGKTDTYEIVTSSIITQIPNQKQEDTQA